ncbi:unnamed protein product [Danaus chrysippus]|uniref:(African queen) hypothetical protein n=1 Tax=Danaus chrysippus TaxID=151541 RepID=A0A8J2W9G0_9NEOP|nr:unnamed protein product [Danaus chrysippus]
MNLTPVLYTSSASPAHRHRMLSLSNTLIHTYTRPARTAGSTRPYSQLDGLARMESTFYQARVAPPTALIQPITARVPPVGVASHNMADTRHSYVNRRRRRARHS